MTVPVILVLVLGMSSSSCSYFLSCSFFYFSFALPRVLDVEMSAQVTDASVPAISSCKLLHSLHIHHAGLTSEGHATLLLSLPHLQLLVRGGFLCEAMEVVKVIPSLTFSFDTPYICSSFCLPLLHLVLPLAPPIRHPSLILLLQRRLENEKEGVSSLPQLELVEFWSSEEYFFHSDQQMELVRTHPGP